MKFIGANFFQVLTFDFDQVDFFPIEFASFQNLFKKSLNHSPHFPEAYIRSKEFYPQKFTHQFCPPESDGPDSGKNVQWASIDWQE